MGSISIQTKNGASQIQNVLLVPSLHENLLSLVQLLENGYKLKFDNNMCNIYDKTDKKQVMTTIEMKNRTFSLNIKYASALQATSNEPVSSLRHKRLGHVNYHNLKVLYNQRMVHGLPYIKEMKGVCEGCAFGKQHRQSFPKGVSWRAKPKLELVHTDVCGPMENPSHAQNRYFILFIDDYTRMTWVYFMRQKSAVFSIFKKFKSLVEKQSGCHIKTLRSDNGTEYTSKEFQKFCEDEGIERQLTVRYTPQQNGVSERKNQTIVEMAKSMMHEKGLPIIFWAEAVYTAVYLTNRCPTKAVWGKTPFEAWRGRKPSLNHLKVFGSICYAHILKVNRSKLGEASERCIFVGYSSMSKGYRIFSLAENKVFISRDVQVDEYASWNWKENRVDKKRFEYNSVPPTNTEDKISDISDNDVDDSPPSTPTQSQSNPEL